MATKNNKGQTCLEKHGISARHEQTVRSDYNIENEYSAVHPDAISDGDVQGKGARSGGHTHWLPQCDGEPSNTINYSNFATSPSDNIGGKYDVENRKEQMIRSIYTYEEPYGANLVDTTENQNEGQYVVGQQID